MATKQELQAELETTKKELDLYRKMFAAQVHNEQPDAIETYEDNIFKFTFEFWRLQAAHGGWVKINTNIYGIPKLIYVDDLGDTSEYDWILQHIYNRAVSIRGF